MKAASRRDRNNRGGKETLTERQHQVWSPRIRNTPTTFGGGIRNTPTTFGGGIRNRNTPTTFGGELDHAQDKKGSEVLDLKEK